MNQLPFFERLQPLSKEIMKKKAPAIFALSPSGVSDKYTFIPTTRLIDDMESFGWLVYSVDQRKGRNTINESTNKHVVRFRNYELEKINGMYPEITLVNAHDGTSSFRFYVGLYDPNTNNSFLMNTKIMEKMVIRHQWYELKEVRKMIHTVINYLPMLKEEMEIMSNIKLTRVMQIKYATAAVRFRWKENAPDIVSQIIRSGNKMKDNTLWEVFSYVQHKLLNGGMEYYTPTKRKQTVRNIKSLDMKIKINKELWDYTKTYIEKKNMKVEMVEG